MSRTAMTLKEARELLRTEPDRWERPTSHKWKPKTRVPHITAACTQGHHSRCNSRYCPCTCGHSFHHYRID